MDLNKDTDEEPTPIPTQIIKKSFSVFTERKSVFKTSVLNRSIRKFNQLIINRKNPYQSREKFDATMLDLRNNIFSKLSGKSLDLLSSRNNPAEEKSISTEIDVGGGVRYFLANFASSSLYLLFFLSLS